MYHNTTAIIVFVVSICVLGYVMWICTHKQLIEHLLIYDVDTKLEDIYVENADLSPKTYNILKSSVPLITTNTKAKHKLILTDAFTYQQNLQTQNKVLTIVNDTKTFLMIKKRNAIPYESLIKCIDRKAKVFSPTSIHKELMNIICLSCGIDPKRLSYTSNADESDISLLYSSLDSIKEQTLEQIDFIDYSMFDINKLKFYLPYCQVRNIPLDVYFSNFNDRFPVKTCLSIEMLLCTPSDTIHYDIAKSFNKYPQNSFFSLFFEFIGDPFYVSKPGHKILEQYANVPIIRPKHNVPGFLSGNGIFLLESSKLDGVPIAKGFTIILENQDNPYENGLYIAIEHNKLERKHEQKNTSLISNGMCIDNPDIDKKEMCPTTWDTPCKNHKDCPYFQKNETYPNYFGGCSDGYCEMPLGVKRIGYKLYDASSSPICYNGPCNITKPDYAYPLDFFERMRSMSAYNL